MWNRIILEGDKSSSSKAYFYQEMREAKKFISIMIHFSE